jgi:protein-tyrosine phosphatase
MVLVVCTANQCRSPLAAAHLRRTLEGSGVAVLDAGTGEGGYPVTDETLATASRRGLDLSGHVSTSVSPAMIDEADLILTMERAHVRSIVVGHPDAWSKTFTLKELVRRAEVVGVRPAGQSIEKWLASLHAGRVPVDLIGASPLDDVADPTGDRRIDHDSVAKELDELVAAAVEFIWPEAIGD